MKNNKGQTVNRELDDYDERIWMLLFLAELSRFDPSELISSDFGQKLARIQNQYASPPQIYMPRVLDLYPKTKTPSSDWLQRFEWSDQIVSSAFSFMKNMYHMYSNFSYYDDEEHVAFRDWFLPLKVTPKFVRDLQTLDKGIVKIVLDDYFAVIAQGCIKDASYIKNHR